MPVKKTLRWFGILPDNRPIGLHTIQLLSRPEELDNPELVPTELKFVFSRDHTLERDVRALLKKKPIAIGVRTTVRTPVRVVQAVERISQYSQHQCITTWLPEFIKEDKRPHILAADWKRAKQDAIDLDKELQIIAKYRGEYKRIMIIHEDNGDLTKEERSLYTRLNRVLDPVETEYATRTIVFDSAHARTEIAQSIIKALLIIGPIAHILEHYARGWGKVFAASVDDLMAEGAELSALRGSGFAWSQLWKRGIVLIPVFIAATWTLLHLEYFIGRHQYFLAGIVFGLCAVALSLTTAIQSVFMFHERVKLLHGEKKLPPRHNLWKEAIVQDFTNPARIGLFCGAVAAPIVAASIFSLFPDFIHNGWVLAMLGTTESIVAGVAVIYARKIGAFRFRRKLQAMIR